MFGVSMQEACDLACTAIIEHKYTIIGLQNKSKCDSQNLVQKAERKVTYRIASFVSIKRTTCTICVTHRLRKMYLNITASTHRIYMAKQRFFVLDSLCIIHMFVNNSFKSYVIFFISSRCIRKRITVCYTNPTVQQNK